MYKKNAYYEYKDNLSNQYLEDYMAKIRGVRLNKKINCIYPERHAKGTDNKPSMSYDKKAGKYHCFACESMANLFDIVKYDNDFKTDTEVINYLRKDYPEIQYFNNDTLGQNRTSTPVQVIDNVEINTDYDFTEFINESNKKVVNSEKYKTNDGIDPNYMVANLGLNYYKQRGLNINTIKKFKLAVADKGFNDVVSNYKELENKSPKQDKYKYIIPMLDNLGNCYNFIAEIVNRKDIDTYNNKYTKPKSVNGLTTQIYNEYHLKTDKPITIFITEGVYDALSIEQLGYNAIALLGTGLTRLENLLKYYKTNANIIIMLDNDKTGKDTTTNILNMLNSLNMQNIKYIDAIDILTNYKNIKDCKDANEMLLKDSKELKSFLTENVKIINKNEDIDRIDNANISNNLDYFRNIESQPIAKLIPTGFTGLDKLFKGGLRTAFYVLGAVSNLGKTAFILQIADQIAKQGIPVLYFSLEMDKKELMARSIARTTYNQVADAEDKNNKPIASDTFDILDNHKYKDYSKDKKDTIDVAINIYENIAKNLYIVSGRYKTGTTSRRMTINDIEKIIKDFIDYKQQVPVIFIDYMQIIAPADPKATDKQNMDEVVDRLKQISIENDTPVISISSYNRDNYYEPANVSAFKESGSIEYGADFILALQYQGIDEIYYDRKSKKSEADKKRDIYEMINNYNQDSRILGKPIPIQLKLIKSRNSSKFNMIFTFKAKYGYFKEDSIDIPQIERKQREPHNKL